MAPQSARPTAHAVIDGGPGSEADGAEEELAAGALRMSRVATSEPAAVTAAVAAGASVQGVVGLAVTQSQRERRELPAARAVARPHESRTQSWPASCIADDELHWQA